ncbi:MAG: biopolymer transporter ExbD [Bacteroidetes bacterium]|nr:biopolymer transporter ExbD [Bacteroidota bacterium]
MALRSVPEVNAGSMADIAFLLLIFFLVTTTMDVDTGISRKLPPPVEDDTDVDIKERNVFKVLVNSSDRLLVEDRPGDIRTLKDQAKEFFMNPYNSEELPEKKLEVIEHLGEVWVSKGVISLKNDRGTSYAMYIKVQDELTKAFDELRNEMSLQYFGVKFENLVDETKREAIQSAIPMAISEAEPENVGGN